jgi:hypothetical protein
MATVTYNRSNILKSAWNLVKTAGKSFSEAMRMAWAEAKAPKVVTTDEYTAKSGKVIRQIYLDGKYVWRFKTCDSKENVIEDAIFELRDSINRTSIFNKKEDITTLVNIVF